GGLTRNVIALRPGSERSAARGGGRWGEPTARAAQRRRRSAPTTAPGRRPPPPCGHRRQSTSGAGASSQGPAAGWPQQGLIAEANVDRADRALQFLGLHLSGG